MKTNSIWLDKSQTLSVTKLNKNIDVDVLIIGGGITGLSTLYYLKDSNLNVCLVEENLIGHGVSGKTTGKINYLQECVYYDICKRYDLDVARKYLDSQKLAIAEMKKIITTEKINCNFKKVKSYVFTNDKNEINKIKLEKKILEKLGVKVNEEKNTEPLKSLYAISVDDTYIFHPIKYLNKLKKICLAFDKKIYEHTKIRQIKQEKNYYFCYTDKYQIKTKKIILACHYPFFLFPFLLPLKASIEKSYITASLSDYDSKTFITSKKPTKSIRYHKDKKEYLIYLSHSSNICDDLNDEKNFKEVINEVRQLGFEPSYIWKNDDLLSIDKIPYIGKIKKDNNNLLMGTGYNTWGMTNGTLAGLILSDMILGKENPYIDLCNPLRVNKLSNCRKFAKNAYGSIKGYIENNVIKNKKWYSSNIEFKKIDGDELAIYKSQNEEYIVYNKCPHLGCRLVFNEVEKTWDCPCHASRFDLTGNCIKGPSRYNIGYKQKKK